MIQVRSFLALALVTGTLAAQGLNSDVVWTRMGDRMRAFSAVSGLMVADIGPVPGGGFATAIDPMRNVWSTDYSAGQNTVRKFDMFGNFVGAYVAGLSVSGLDSSVGPLAIDRLGNVYVGDPRQNGTRITKLDNNGNLITTWNVTGASVRSMVVDPDGNLWVVTYSNNFNVLGYLEKFSPTGTLLFRYNVTNATPNGTYCDEYGKVYLTHSPQYPTFQVFNLQGTIIGQGTTPSGLDLGAVSVAPNGRVWIVEFFGNEALEVFSPTFTSLGSWNLPRSGAGIAIDAFGKVWVSTFDPSFSGTPLELVVRNPNGSAWQTIAGGIQSSSGYSFNLGDFTGMAMARTVDPTGDMDGDGRPNIVEVRAGSSPLDPSSIPIEFFVQSPPRIGTTMTIGITSPDGALPYFMPFSLNASLTPLRILNPLDGRILQLSFLATGAPTLFDPIWELSTSGTFPGNVVFPNTFGVTDAAGTAVVNVVIPNLPILVGNSMFGACLSLNPSALSGVQRLSPFFAVTFLP